MITVNAAYCPQSHRCPTMRVCPTGALQQEGYNAPTIDQELCIDCGKCTSSCPVFSQSHDGVPANGSNGRGGESAKPEEAGSVLQWFRREIRR